MHILSTLRAYARAHMCACMCVCVYIHIYVKCGRWFAVMVLKRARFRDNELVMAMAPSVLPSAQASCLPSYMSFAHAGQEALELQARGYAIVPWLFKVFPAWVMRDKDLKWGGCLASV